MMTTANKAKPKAKPMPRILSIRMTDADCDLLARLREKTRLTTTAEITRQAWRTFAIQEKVLKG